MNVACDVITTTMLDIEFFVKMTYSVYTLSGSWRTKGATTYTQPNASSGLHTDIFKYV